MIKTLFITVMISIVLFVGSLEAHDRKFSTISTKTINPTFTIKHLNNDGEPHQVLFEGFKESVGIESGKVTMSGGQKGEKHSTEIYEEVLIILDGTGEIEMDGEKHKVTKGDSVYIPPHLVHQLSCDKGDKFEYIYVAAPTFLPSFMQIRSTPPKEKKKEKIKDKRK